MDLDAELAFLFQRAGLTVSDERRAQVLVAYTELRSQVEMLRPRPASLEPATVYRLQREG